MNSHTRRNMGFGLGSHWFRGRRYHRCFQPDTGHMPYDKMPILIGVPAAVFGMGAGLLDVHARNEQPQKLRWPSSGLEIDQARSSPRPPLKKLESW